MHIIQNGAGVLEHLSNINRVDRLVQWWFASPHDFGRSRQDQQDAERYLYDHIPFSGEKQHE